MTDQDTTDARPCQESAERGRLAKPRNAPRCPDRGSSRDRAGSCLTVQRDSVLPNADDAACGGNVGRRVAAHEDHRAPGARADTTAIREAELVRRRRRCGSESFQGTQPRVHQQCELAVQARAERRSLQDRVGACEQADPCVMESADVAVESRFARLRDGRKMLVTREAPDRVAVQVRNEGSVVGDRIPRQDAAAARR